MRTTIKRLLKACKYSFCGLKVAYINEQAFRQEVWIAFFLIPTACVLNLGCVERLFLVGSVLFVLMVELINSAIETVVDYISTEKHPLAGIAKDLGSAAVMVSILNVIIVWMFILINFWAA